MSNPFTLQSYQVPDPPESSLWTDLLRWIVMVVDPDDKQLPFIASCLAYSFKHNGLTEKQALVCNKILQRVIASFDSETLFCQNIDFDDAPHREGSVH